MQPTWKLKQIITDPSDSEVYLVTETSSGKYCLVKLTGWLWISKEFDSIEELQYYYKDYQVLKNCDSTVLGG